MFASLSRWVSFFPKTQFRRQFFRLRRNRLELEYLESRLVPGIWTVTNASATGNGSLAWAVGQANSDGSAALIQFNPAFFNTARTITLSATLTLSNTSRSITIDGTGVGPITVSGGGLVQVMSINTNVIATLQNLTISGGFTLTNGGGINTAGTLTINNCNFQGNRAPVTASGRGYGGGINNLGYLMVNNCNFSNNMAGNGGGGIYNTGTLNIRNNSSINTNNANDGGGIYNDNGGNCQIQNSQLNGNSAAEHVGAIESQNATLTLTNCVLNNNTAPNTTASGGIGAVYASGNLTITNCTLNGNSSGYQAGAILFAGIIATIQGCTISNNSAIQDGGAIYLASGMTTLDNCTISGNSARNGAGISSSGTATITNAIIQNNNSTQDGGGIANYGTLNLTGDTFTSNSSGQQGGAIVTGFVTTSTITNCNFTSNKAGDGGAIHNDAVLTITGSTFTGNTSNVGTQTGDGGAIINYGSATVSGSTFTGNLANNNGGALSNRAGSLTVNSNCMIQNNTAGGSGGGINILAGTTCTVSGSTLASNTANSSTAGQGGGGIFSTGTLTVAASTLSGNSCVTEGGGINNHATAMVRNSILTGNTGPAGGGAVYNEGGLLTVLGTTMIGNTGSFGGAIDNRLGSTATIQNSTFNGNTCNGGSGGGAIGNFLAGTTLTLSHVTIAGNTCTVSGGGLYNSGTANLTNTIVAGNNTTLAGPDINQAGGTITASYSLIGDSTASGIAAGNGNILDPKNPGLGTLGNNGGTPAPTTPPQTIPLVPGSPAIDKAGPDTQLNAPIADNVTTFITISNMAAFAAAALPVLPSGYFTIQVGQEEMLVTALASGGGGTATLTVVRGSHGTTPGSHAAAADVFLISDERGSLPSFNMQVPAMNMGAVNIGKNPGGVVILEIDPGTQLPDNSTDVVIGGNTDQYTVVLTSQPSANVTIMPVPDSYETVPPAPPLPLVFTPTNWNIPQSVTVTANPNLTGPGPFTGTIRHTATSSDTSYQGISVANVTVHITQGPGVFIQPKTITIIEAIASATYWVQLQTQPAADVTITCYPSSGLFPNPSTLTFTSANWNVPQTVTVSAPDDGTFTGFRTGTITHSAASGDANYNGVPVTNVAVNILDNDGFIIYGTKGNDSITVNPSPTALDPSRLLVNVNGALSFISGAVISQPPYGQLFIWAGDGNDTIQLNSPSVPALVYTGLGNDSLTVMGQGGDNSFAIGQVTLDANGNTIGMYGVENLTVNGLGENDTFTVNNNPDQSLTGVTFNGGLGRDTITGPNSANTWKITATNTGFLNNITRFTGFENLTGGSGNDTFSFSAGKNVTGKIDGGGGTDVLDDSLFTTPLTFNLQTGSATGTGGIQNIETILAGKSTNDKLIGPDVGGTWNTTTKNAGVVAGVSFQNVENLTGGSGDDAFTFSAGSSLTGKLDAGSGTDTLDYSAFSTPISINLQSRKATAITGGIASIEGATGGLGNNTLTAVNQANTWNIADTNTGSILYGTGTFTFAGFANLVGGSSSDTFNVTGSLTGTLNGGLGNDTLVGLGTGSHAWSITGTNAGNLDGLPFIGIENLTGGSEDDTFTLNANGKVTGKIDGDAGNNALDYSALTTAVSINLATGKATNTGGILNLDQFMAGINLNNFLTAQNLSNAWNLTAANAGTITNTAGTYSFTGFQNLTGGNQDDAFTLAVADGWTGYLQGGLGSDTLTAFGTNNTWTANTLNGHKFGSIENHP